MLLFFNKLQYQVEQSELGQKQTKSFQAELLFPIPRLFLRLHKTLCSLYFFAEDEVGNLPFKTKERHLKTGILFFSKDKGFSSKFFCLSP